MRRLSVPTPYLIGDLKAYTFEVNGELILFDTGPMTAKALAYLEKEIEFDRLKYVFITHWHPEHCGLAALLEERTAAKIVLSKHEVWRLRNPENYFRKLGLLLAELDFPEFEKKQVIHHLQELYAGIPAPDSMLSLEESHPLLGDLGIDYFYCPFHSARDVIYLLGNYMVSGDIVLEGTYSSPCIEPDPSSSSGRRFNNYHALCAGISQLKNRETYELLPSHWQPVGSVDGWIKDIVSKIIERTDAVAPLLLGGKSVYETTVHYFGERIKRNTLFFYIKASEVNLSRDFIEEPFLLIETLNTNQILGQTRKLFEHGWLKKS